MIPTTLKHRQSGLSIMSFLMWVIIIGIIAAYASQFGLIYLRKKTVRDNIQQVLAEAKTRETMTAREIQTSLMKRFDINDIQVKREDIIITKNGDSYTVSISMTKEFKIGDDIRVIVDSDVEESSAGTTSRKK